MKHQTNIFYSKDFLILILGQVISLFGNAILRFSIPLYLLSSSGSTIAFSLNLAISVLPIIFLSPINGLIADLFPKRNTMILLDLTTSLIALSGLFVLKSAQPFFLFTIITLWLSIIQAIYQPTVLSSIPLLIPKRAVGKANALVNQVQSLANIIGPALGGILFHSFGIQSIIVLAIISFAVSALVECFMQIPKLEIKKGNSLFRTIKEDTLACFDFFKHKRILLEISLLVTTFNLFFESMLLIGIPQIILNLLHLDSTFYGLTQAAQSLGALAGGLILTIFIDRFQIARSYWFFASTLLFLLPIPIVMLLELPAISIAAVICLCCFLFMISSTIFSIMMISFIQSITPHHLMGKIISYVYALTTCARPVGQLMYGYLFEAYSNYAAFILFATILVNVLVSFYAKKILSKIRT